MIFGFFTLLVALAISGIAAYYSIVGLTAIFSAAVIPIIIMGAALEIGKVTAAVWLKMNWSKASFAYKMYLVPAVAVLMLLTSMGIFGFLSKAHSDQSLETSNADARIVIIDEKIKTERDAIEVARRALKQLDEQVDQVMARSKDERGAERSAQIRRNQARERTKLLSDIEAAQKKIATLNEERAPLAAEFRKIESEVGPIKYIAALVYDDTPDNTVLEKAVRLVIIIIVAVFDPLALVLILAAQQSLRWANQERLKKKQIKSLMAKESQNENVIPKVVTAPLQDDHVNTSARAEEIKVTPPAPPADDFDISKHAYLTKPWAHFPSKPPIPGTLDDRKEEPATVKILDELVVESPAVKEAGPEVVETLPDTAGNKSVEAVDARRGFDTPPKEAAERFNRKLQKSTLKADNEIKKVNEVKAHFGINFPTTPEKGELYLRVDYYPSKLYKFNGSKWIEVDKNLTDSYVYNEEYIKYLIEEIDKGRVDSDDLSPSEKNQIAEILTKNEQGRNPS